MLSSRNITLSILFSGQLKKAKKKLVMGKLNANGMENGHGSGAGHGSCPANGPGYTRAAAKATTERKSMSPTKMGTILFDGWTRLIKFHGNKVKDRNIMNVIIYSKPIKNK